MRIIRTVQSGAGALYPAHVGVLQRLEESFLISDATGVSGGAIVDAALASGYSTRDDALQALILSTLPGPNNLVDYSWWPFSRYGLIRGDRLLQQFRTTLAPTFRAAFDVSGIKLSVVTADMSTRAFKVWSYDETPDADLPLVVRASMSIPLLFKYVEIDGHVHVDGGTLSNFPLDRYGTGADVVGVRIFHTKEALAPDEILAPIPIRSFRGYLSAVLDAMMQAMMREHVEDAMFAQLIRVRVEGLSGTDFAMTPAQARSLIDIGYQAADKFLGREG